jgi:hypothetical protein
MGGKPALAVMGEVPTSSVGDDDRLRLPVVDGGGESPDGKIVTGGGDDRCEDGENRSSTCCSLPAGPSSSSASDACDDWDDSLDEAGDPGSSPSRPSSSGAATAGDISARGDERIESGHSFVGRMPAG